MKKLFVLVPYMGRTDEEIQAIRENTLLLYKNATHEDAELSIPHGKRLTGDLEAMFDADVVVGVKYHAVDPVCAIIAQAAYVYGRTVIEDRDVAQYRLPENEQNEGGESE